MQKSKCSGYYRPRVASYTRFASSVCRGIHRQCCKALGSWWVCCRGLVLLTIRQCLINKATAIFPLLKPESFLSRMGAHRCHYPLWHSTLLLMGIILPPCSMESKQHFFRRKNGLTNNTRLRRNSLRLLALGRNWRQRRSKGYLQINDYFISC